MGWPPSLPRFSAVLPGPLPRFSARLLPLALPQARQGTETLDILRVSGLSAHDCLSGRLAKPQAGCGFQAPRARVSTAHVIPNDTRHGATWPALLGLLYFCGLWLAGLSGGPDLLAVPGLLTWPRPRLPLQTGLGKSK